MSHHLKHNNDNNNFHSKGGHIYQNPVIPVEIHMNRSLAWLWKSILIEYYT